MFNARIPQETFNFRRNIKFLFLLCVLIDHKYSFQKNPSYKKNKKKTSIKIEKMKLREQNILQKTGRSRCKYYNRKNYHLHEPVMIGCSRDQDGDDVGGAAWPGEAVGTARRSSGWAPPGCPAAAGSPPPPAGAPIPPPSPLSTYTYTPYNSR